MNIHDITFINGKKIIKWCYNNYGYSLFNNNYVKFNLSEETFNDKIYYGQYLKNEIILYKNNIKSFKMFTIVIIHEYIHHLQDGEMYDKYHYEYNKTYNYHPYEIQAENISKRDYKQCIKEVFNNESQLKKSRKRIKTT